MYDELRGVRRGIRRRSWLLRSAQVRLAARRAFDLPRFGNGPAERLTAALVLGAVFFGVFLAAGSLAGLAATHALLAAGAALLTAMVTSAVLVLWTRDDEALESQQERAADELEDLRTREVDLLDRISADEARRASDRPTTKRCPYCRETILINAVKCRHCGEVLDEGLRREREPQAWNPGVAAVLSFLIPGLGQMYKGQVLNGLAWLFVVVVGYVCGCAPGIVLHIVCLFEAASGGKRR